MANHNLRGIGVPLPARALLLVLVAALALAASLAAAKPMPRPVMIGVLTLMPAMPPQAAAMRDGLESLGYVEGRDFVLGVWFASNDYDLLDRTARRLAALGSDIIFAADAAAARAVKKARTPIPTVFVSNGNPLDYGLIESFRRPGGTLTGVTGLQTDLLPKALEMFQRLHPAMRRIYMPYAGRIAGLPGRVRRLRKLERAATHLGVTLFLDPIETIEQSREKLLAVRRSRFDGIFYFGSVMRIGEFAEAASLREKIPVMVSHPFFLEREGFAMYGADYNSMGRQAARLVDKIIRGENPADIPVEVNNDVQLVINLRTAKRLGIEIPKKMLYRADRIIR